MNPLCKPSPLRVSPDLLPVIRELTSDALQGQEAMSKHDSSLLNLAPTGFNVSTMTFVFKLSLTKIDINEIASNWDSLGAKHMGCPISIALPKTKPKRKAVGDDNPVDTPTFFNQLTLRVHDAYGNKAAKIFVNGAMQLAGAKNVKDAVFMVQTVCMLLEQVSRAPRVEAETIQVCMINTNFCLNKKLRLLEVKNLLSGAGKQCSYDPDGYPAASFKHKNVSIFVFNTGKIIVTGGKSFGDVLEGYSFITSFVDSNLMAVEAKPFVL